MLYRYGIDMVYVVVYVIRTTVTIWLQFKTQKFVQLAIANMNSCAYCIMNGYSLVTVIQFVVLMVTVWLQLYYLFTN